jgi:hypothetical protein
MHWQGNYIDWLNALDSKKKARGELRGGVTGGFDK